MSSHVPRDTLKSEYLVGLGVGNDKEEAFRLRLREARRVHVKLAVECGVETSDRNAQAQCCNIGNVDAQLR